MGRPWPEVGEPFYTDDDREAVLEWMYEQNLKCPGCGMPRDESMDPASQKDAYDVHILRCHACAERERKAEEFRRGEGDPAGILYTIERRRE